MNDSVSISQKLYLLGINPTKGGIVSSAGSSMGYILVGGVLLELFQSKNIGFENKRVVIKSAKAQNSLHRFILDKMVAKNKPLKVSSWINRLNMSAKTIRKEVQKPLIEKRIIKMQPQKFLFFRWERPFLVNKSLVYHLTDDIRTQIAKGTSIEEELLVLSLLKPAGLLNRLYPERKKRKEAQKRLNKIMAKNQVSIAVSDAIAAAQAVAASVAVSSATIATSG